MYYTELEKWFWERLKNVFWKHVDKTGDCWEWIGNRNKWGYGKITIMKKTFAAHRVSWELENGPIPEGMSILHKCDNPACVRPGHLFIGSQSQNILDSVRKKRQIGNRKLTKEQVKQIREMRLEATSSELAKLFGVSRHTILNIWEWKSWK